MKPFIILSPDDQPYDQPRVGVATYWLVWIGNNPGQAYDLPRFCKIVEWHEEEWADEKYDVHFDQAGRFPLAVLQAARTGRDTDQSFKTMDEVLAFILEIYIECCKH